MLFQALSAASVSSTWNNASGGSWFTAVNWTHNPPQSTVPDNGTDTFDVTVATASGSPYIVSIGSSATVTKLNLNSSNAIITQAIPATTVSVLDTFTLGSGSYHLNGGTLAPATLILHGGSLSFAGGTLAPCNITLNGGTVLGGSLTTSGAGQLHLAANSSNILDGTTLVGGLLFDVDGGKVKLRNDATFAPSDCTLGASSNTLFYEGTATDATASISSTLNLNGVGGSVNLFGLPTRLTVTPSGRIRGRGTVYANAANCELLNQGITSADLAGQSLSLETNTVTNASGATLRAQNGGTLSFNPSIAFNNLAGSILSTTGGSTVTLLRNWHNSGIIVIADTSVLNLQGSCTTADLGLGGWLRSGGTVNLQAALDNTGTTLDLATCGTLILNGGSIKGGSILSTPTARLAPNFLGTNLLDAVAYQGTLVLDQNNFRVRLRNDATFTGSASLTANGAALIYEGTADESTALLANASINLDGTNGILSLIGTAPVLTIAPTAVVRGSGSFNQGTGGTFTGTPTVINQGLISADVAGQTFALSIAALTNTGVLEAKSGAILSLTPTLANQSAGTFRLAGGAFQITSNTAGPEFTVGASARLEGYGEVRFTSAATDSLSLAGTLAPALGTGGLAIKGDLIPSASAVLAFDLAGATQATGYDFVAEAGATPLNLAGCTLQLTLAVGFTPTNAQVYTILTSTQTITGAFGNVASGSRLATTEGRGTFRVSYTGTSVVLSEFQPTPKAAYINWLDAAFPGVSDPDGDGVPNLQEFAFHGNPTSATSRGLTTCAMQNVDPAPGNEFTFVLAVRTGAVFTQQPDGSQRNLAAVESLHYSVQGSTTLGTFNQPVLHSGPTFAPPAGTGLPDLTGSGWEYHTFYLDPAVAGTRRFLRAVVDNQ